MTVRLVAYFFREFVRANESMTVVSWIAKGSEAALVAFEVFSFHRLIQLALVQIKQVAICLTAFTISAPVCAEYVTFGALRHVLKMLMLALVIPPLSSL